MKDHARIVFSRLLYVALFVTLQAAAIIVMFNFSRANLPYFYAGCIVLSLLAAIHILNGYTNPAYKIAWLIPILLLPIFGGLLYLMFGFNRSGRRFRAMAKSVQKQYAAYSPLVASASLADESDRARLDSRYISRAAGCAPYSNTGVAYFPVGEDFFASLTEELKKAKKFIFLEYFILEEGKMWDTILAILEQKVQEGVEVRVMFDDFGCLLKLPPRYEKTLRAKGIRVHVFNPFNTILSPRFNNRDHRKICVIDGDTGYTGGINLADEYINAVSKFGHWKDTAVQLKGRAVWSLTLQFLSVWDFCAKEKEDYTPYAPSAAAMETPSDGIVQPYSDIPADDELVGETVYLNMINRAKSYVYITTPYLIVDNEMLTALKTAAKSGVDVRIITPHVPDKKIVFFLTRSYYQPLTDAGVKIFEYTPGFIHAKSMVADDATAVVGTINLDYRSLYLHLECAVWMHGSAAVMDVKRDFLRTEARCQVASGRVLGRMTWIKQVGLSVLRALSPLL